MPRWIDSSPTPGAATSASWRTRSNGRWRWPAMRRRWATTCCRNASAAPPRLPSSESKTGCRACRSIRRWTRSSGASSRTRCAIRAARPAPPSVWAFPVSRSRR
jgi:hypothetical protein